MAIAVKAFIVNDGRLLIVKRATNDRYMPGVWEIPGGKLDDGEDMETALLREVKEEVGLSIEINREISVREFRRSDGPDIEMHIFLCNALSDIDKVKLSEEHSLYKWIEIEKCKSELTEFFHPEVDLLLDLENERWP